MTACPAPDDGRLVYAVRTTGVFCRPGCPAPPARPEHTAYFADAAAAEAAGYRPCKRCHPTAPPLHVAQFDTPVGPLLAAATDAGVCLLDFADRLSLEAQLSRVAVPWRGPPLGRPHPHLDALQTQLAAYFAGARQHFSVPLHCRGTPFQERVWAQLQAIPYGETRTYAELAAAVGQPRAVRAAGSANGANPVAIVVPCHRVIRTGGGLGGYGGGLERKRFLLALEQPARG